MSEKNRANSNSDSKQSDEGGQALESLREELEKEELTVEEKAYIDLEEGKILELEENLFDKILLNVSTVAFIIMTLMVWSQVFTRQIGASLPWTEELARYLLIFCTFWGSAVALRADEHIRITTFLDMLPARVRGFLELIGYVLVSGFIVFAAFGAYQRAAGMWNVPIASGVGWIRMGYIYGSVFIGLLFCQYYLIKWIIVKIKLVIKGFEAAAAGQVEEE